jgi:hypothetical protein
MNDTSTCFRIAAKSIAPAPAEQQVHAAVALPQMNAGVADLLRRQAAVALLGIIDMHAPAGAHRVGGVAAEVLIGQEDTLWRRRPRRACPVEGPFEHHLRVA